MRKAWKVVTVIALVIMVLAAVLFAVGMLTGADMDRIYSVLNSRYSLGYYIQYFADYINSISIQMY